MLWIVIVLQLVLLLGLRRCWRDLNALRTAVEAMTQSAVAKSAAQHFITTSPGRELLRKRMIERGIIPAEAK